MEILVKTPEAKEGFYPTPLPLARKLLSGIDWKMVATVLEPSAGKGDLAKAIATVFSEDYAHSGDPIKIDCVEIDPYLRAALTVEFSKEHKNELWSRKRAIEDAAEYDPKTRSLMLSPEEKAEVAYLRKEAKILESVDVTVVHDDFLTFDSRKCYNLIVMNPPFAAGEKHLWKAISCLEPYGGEIRCILNAETLRNLCTKQRMLLAQKLKDLGAEISFHTEAFANAERPTLVDVAIIKAKIPEPNYAEDPNSLYQRMKQARQIEDLDHEVTDLTLEDAMHRIVAQFNFEVDAGLRLIREYRSMRPYVMDTLDPNDRYPSPTLTLCVGDPSRHFRGDLPNSNKFLEKTRYKYWSALLNNKEFTGKLTANLQNKYRGMIDELVRYDFTLFNIQRIYAEMNAEMAAGIRDTIVALFDQMTAEHTWYPEMAKNLYLFSGWKTNKAHKVAFPKVILPVNGLFSEYSWCKPFDLRRAEEILSDIEKVFNYLDGNMTAPVRLDRELKNAHESGLTKDIHLKYFSTNFYKKGTIHIRFHSRELIDRFNIYCCQQKGWLPPDYGKRKYQDMSEESKAVVDGFHGNGTPGSGESAYSAILVRSDYYLAPVTQSIQALPAAHAEEGMSYCG